jgi:pantoate--beta-alanine ligase
MEVFQKRYELQTYLQEISDKGDQIGFIPTMGALHQGHLSLVKACKKQDDCCVCSIFVNPTQFDDSDDLDTYPRELQRDIEKLEKQGVEILFAPPESEMYPEGYEEDLPFDFGRLDTVLEGAHREGHFTGVAQIVSKLLQAVQPHKLYLGQKDYQQFLIIKSLIDQMEIEVTPVLCPIVREEDGLAISSRNVRLNKTERKAATKIYETLLYCQRSVNEVAIPKLKEQALNKLKAVSSFKKIDYFEICDAHELMPVSDAQEATDIIACTAVRLARVRLIDNMFLKRKTIKLATV